MLNVNYAECRSQIMLSVANEPIMLSVIMLSVIAMNLVAPNLRLIIAIYRPWLRIRISIINTYHVHAIDIYVLTNIIDIWVI